MLALRGPRVNAVALGARRHSSVTSIEDAEDMKRSGVGKPRHRRATVTQLAEPEPVSVFLSNPKPDQLNDRGSVCK